MVIIQGMNHAQFGDYGRQKGDNISEISDESALQIVEYSVKNFLYGTDDRLSNSLE